MTDKADFLHEVAGAVSDGEPIDWAALSRSPEAAQAADVLEELAILARVADASRRSDGSGAGARPDSPATPPGEAGSEAHPVRRAATGEPPTWGAFTLLERIGEGAFGEVFRAHDHRLDRQVALKLLRRAGPEQTGPDGAAVSEEGRLLARVRHPNVVTVHGAEAIDGRIGIWTEFIEGHTLAARIAERGPMPAEEVAGVGVDLCHALQAVHEAGLLHRDIKAQNVMRESTGRVVLMDFGTGHDLRGFAARLNDLSGTPVYLAPEMYAGGGATRASDIYALAVLLFYLLTGRYPVAGQSVSDLVEQHRAGRTRTLHDLRPDLSAALVNAIERGLAPDPARRYADAAGFAAALDAARNIGRSTESRHPSRRLTIAASVPTLLVVGAIVVGVSLLGRRDPEPSPAQTAGPFRFRVISDYFKDAKTGGPAAVQISPDGASAVYARTRPAPAAPGDDHPAIDRVFVRNLTTGRERQLMDLGRSDARVNALTWSPDSQSVAAVICIGPPQPPPQECVRNEPSELRILTPGGGDRLIERSPTGIEPVAWSPGSRYVAFVVAPHATPPEIRVRDLSGPGPATVVASGAAPPTLLWSRDGQHLAWVEHPMAPLPEIMVAGVADESRRAIPLTGLPTGQRAVNAEGWTADDHIAFRILVRGKTNDEYLMPATGGAFRQLAECRAPFGGDGCGGLTPDGRFTVRELTATDGGRLVFRDVASGTDRPLTQDPVREDMAVPPVNATGLIAFNSNRDGRSNVYIAAMDRLPAEQPLWIAEGTARSGRWTSTGLVLQLAASSMNIYRLNLDPTTARATGTLRRLTHDAPNNAGPSVSPDGRQVAYFRHTDSAMESLAVMNADGTNEHDVRAFPSPQAPNYVAWRSPTEIVLVGGNGQGHSTALTLKRLDLDSNVETPMTPVMIDQARGVGTSGLHPVPPALVRAIDTLFVWAAREPTTTGGRLRARSIRSETDRLIEMPDTAEAFTVSPDGRLVAYSTLDRTRTPVIGDIRIRSLDRGPDRVLVRFENRATDDFYAPLEFSPNGRFLIYRDNTPVLRVLDLQTTESWPLIVDPPSGVEFGWSRVSWAPDGSFVLFRGASGTNEWRAYDGLTKDAVDRLVGAKR